MGNQCNMAAHASDEVSVDRQVVPHASADQSAPGLGWKAAEAVGVPGHGEHLPASAPATAERPDPASTTPATSVPSGELVAASAVDGKPPPEAPEHGVGAGALDAAAPPSGSASSGSYANPSAINDLVGDGICAICLEPLRNRAQTIAMCGHIFHRSCINSYGGSSCPSCRCPIDEPAGMDAASSALAGLQPGTVVELVGLTSAQQYNGQSAEIMTFNESLDRYTVRLLSDGSVKAVRRQNVRHSATDGVSRSRESGRAGRGGGNSSGHTLTVNEFIARAKRDRENGVAMTGRELKAYARYLGIDPVADDDLLWVAEEALMAPVPAEWSEHLDNCDRLFYYNARLRTSSWTHPLEQAHRDMYRRLVACRSPQLSDAERAGECELLRRKCEETANDARDELEAWSEHADEHGRKFFYKRHLRRSSWTEPMPALQHMILFSQKICRELTNLDGPRQAASGNHAADHAPESSVDLVSTTQRSL